MESIDKKKKFLLNELILIALLAAAATAVKVIVGVMVRTLTSSIGIPGGAIAGGFYMLWLAMGVGLIKKFGTAALVSMIQALTVFIGGLPGSHGILTFLTYVAPAIALDLVFLISKNKNYNILHYIVGTMIANIIGTYGTNLVFFRMPILPLLFVLSSAMLSGALGGVIAYLVIKKINTKPNYKLKNHVINGEENNLNNVETDFQKDDIKCSEDKYLKAADNHCTIEEK